MIGDDPEYARRKLLPVYVDMLIARARQGFFGDLYIKVQRSEYLQLMYETHLYRGVAANGGTPVWAPWPTDPNQNMPSAVEIRLPGGRIMFRSPVPTGAVETGSKAC